MTKYIQYPLLLIFGILSIISFGYVVTKTLDHTGSIDFHSYWYAGQFIRQGKDPFMAFLSDETPSVPVKYLDGKITTHLPIAQPGLARVPANTAPMVFLLSIFSFFSWPLAKVLWMVCNLVFMVLVPWMTLHLAPDWGRLRPGVQLGVYLVFWGLFGTRNIAGNGQTSLFVFVLMLVSLLYAEKNWLVAGIALGLALSKYSLAFPLFLFLLFKRKYRILVMGLVIQLIGLVGITLLAGTPPQTVFQEYLQILRFHIDQPGIHLTSLFPNENITGFLIDILFALIILALLGYRWIKLKSASLTSSVKQFIELNLITSLVLWTLLIAYHRAYDTFVAILFIILIAGGFEKESPWKFSQVQKAFLAGILILSIVILTLPARGIGSLSGIFPISGVASWLVFQGNSVTITLIVMLLCSIWLFFRVGGAESSKERPVILGQETQDG